jgi:hypothetical protein
MKDSVLKITYILMVIIENSERCQVIKNRRILTKLWLIEMFDFWNHGNLLKNCDNPGGRTLRSFHMLKASESTLNLI